MDCINLEKRFGKRYRVRCEESYYAQYGPNARADEPWLMIVPCRYGHIFPHGGNLLAASVDGHPNVAGVLRRLPCCRIHQDGDRGELTVLFDVGDLPQVAKIMQPKRRRQLSSTARERLRRMGFQKAAKAHVEVEPTLRPCVLTTLDGSEHVLTIPEAKLSPEVPND